MISRADIERGPLNALTLWQPWGWAMFHGKPVENRTWHPPRRLVGQVVAIHAGKRYDVDAFPTVAELMALGGGGLSTPCPTKDEIALGAILGLARLVNSLDHQDPPPTMPRPLGAAPCGCRGIAHADACPYLSPWFFGPVGWVFAEPLEFREPIPCMGHQGLWRVDNDLDLYRAVLTAVDTAGAAT